MDMGAYVVVINAEQVTVTGNKPDAKLYFRHVNGRPGSWKTETFNELQRVSGCVGGTWCTYIIDNGQLGALGAFLGVVTGGVRHWLLARPWTIVHECVES